MPRRFTLRAPLAVLASALLGTVPLLGSRAAEKDAQRRPNIVLILADDLGYSDLGCYGGEIHTPNLDHLAADGLRYTRFYNTGRCCPTRASLLTGLYPHQAGIGAMTFDRGLPGYRGQLRKDTPTIAEVLRGAGYRTAMSGKWHVSLTRELPDHLRHLNNQEIAETFADPSSYPAQRGFERYFGCIWGVVNYFDPFSLVDGMQSVRSVPKDFYMTDALTDRALKDVDEFSRDPQKPFFLYLAYTAPHWPLHARPEDLAKYKETYQVGWDAIRAARYRRQAELGLLDPKTAELSPRNQKERRWEDNPDRTFDAATFATHAAMVDRMDQNIGRLVERLKAQGQLDNTLLFFLSDNGASPESYPEGGFDRPTETRDGRKILHPGVLRKSGVLPGPETTFGTIGPVWASVANTPLRLWKAQTAEGGICTPLIVHWPAHIPEKGKFRGQPGHVIDFMATAVAVSGAQFPAEFGGGKTTPPEGRSLLPSFSGQTTRETPLFFEHEGNMAMIDGDWKAVNTRGLTGKWELYHLSTDRTEMHDVADQEPERLQAMLAKWKTWADRTLVKPAPQPFRN